MKKIYSNPTIEVVEIEVRASLLDTSSLSKGENWSSGNAAGRSFDFTEDE